MDFKKNPRTDFKSIQKLSKEQMRREIDALREGIEYHDYLYYVKNQPAISDETYDKLFQRLQQLEKAFPEFSSAVSPTARVGGQPAARLEKVRHTAPMLSLSAVYKEKEVEDFDRMVRREAGGNSVEYTAEPKFDGLSVEDLKQIEGFAEKSARQLYDAIQRAKKAPLDRFLYALGIHRVGQHTARTVAHHFGSIEAPERAGLPNMEVVEGIGSTVAQSIYRFFQQDQTRQTLRQLSEAGVEGEPMPSHKTGGRRTESRRQRTHTQGWRTEDKERRRHPSSVVRHPTRRSPS